MKTTFLMTALMPFVLMQPNTPVIRQFHGSILWMPTRSQRIKNKLNRKYYK